MDTRRKRICREKWSCASCTFENESKSTRCRVSRYCTPAKFSEYLQPLSVFRILRHRLKIGENSLKFPKIP